MKTKQDAENQHTSNTEGKSVHLQQPRQQLSMMAVQEKLGLFRIRRKPKDSSEKHDYLKKKPLGLI